MKRYVGLLTLLAAAALIAPAPAGALIQIDQGIAGVRLNNTKAEVRAALGTPNRVVNGTNDFGNFTEYRYAGRIFVLFQGRRRVTGVTTRGLGDRTTKGVGVRSREGSVRRKVPGVTCETIIGDRTCHTGTFTAGERVTDFKIRRGRVRSVTVGIVID
jgi:hypothetical protein